MDEIVQNKGGLLEGPGGTGKTEVIRRLITKLQAQDPKPKILTLALRHAARAQLPQGDTIAHAMQRRTTGAS